MTTLPQIRLHLFFATSSDRAVILRQGPARQFRMILWYRDEDRFDDGQWLKAPVYTDYCALSPDGRHFLYVARDSKRNGESLGNFTALSRPPYWTALALFPQDDPWGGGGVFLDDVHYHASGHADIIGRAEGLDRVTMGKPEKGCTTGIRLMNGRRAPLSRDATRRLLDPAPPSDMQGVMARMAPPLSDELQNYATEGGKLFRRRGEDLDLIRDFTDMKFTPLRAPYDWRDPAGPNDWHPLDGEVP